MMKRVTRNATLRCSAKRNGRRCKFETGHEKQYQHEDALGKKWGDMPTGERLDNLRKATR